MKQDEITENTIINLVNSFYDKVKTDKDLGPIFIKAIGTSDQEWQTHLTRMYDFWSSVMLATGRYNGSPLQKHIALPHFDKALFKRWLELFEETANEIHTDKIANEYVIKSHRIANTFTHIMYKGR